MAKANEILAILKEMLPEVRTELAYENLYQLTVAVVLSAQATDVAVNKATPALFARYPDFTALAQADYDELREMIKTIGLAPTKARNLINLSRKLVSEKGGMIVPDPEYLLTLPGIGRKSANVILSEGFGIPRLAVDTHVARVANRLGLAAATAPARIEAEICALYPPAEWHQLHLRLVLFGRYHCLARKPRCHECKLTAYCQYYTNIAPVE
ncbi:MAG TPA: endonuclease III [Acholeplasmataceae bacterium]|jgi:endonuclease-3|nr:endonuclease III [Acholeplasmataceae bacterium]